jgi:hypothetical protein
VRSKIKEFEVRFISFFYFLIECVYMDERNKHLGVQSGAVSPFKSPNLNEKLTNTEKEKVRERGKG